MKLQPALRLGILLICALILSSSACFAKVVYVKTTGLDANDGLSWNTAKKTVQSGITAAVSGDEVWVSQGAYVERITLKAGVGLYGGFIGTETLQGQRDWKTNVTTLDGNKGGSVVTSPSGATSTTRIDGFTIRNGNTSTNGGGIYCDHSSPTITNNTITKNTASTNGGGIYCHYYSSPTITNNTIIGNDVSYSGGGICCTDHSSPTITNNTISENSAYYYGGAIYCSDSSLTITNNTITENRGGNCGGGIYCYFSSPMITNNTITGNTAASGGGVECFASSPTIACNTIIGNSVTYDGGAIECIGASPRITNNMIEGNGGGGIYCWDSSPAITNNTITGNSGLRAGGIGCENSSSPAISNNIIAFNSSGIYREDDGTPILRNNCVTGNMERNYSGLTAGTGDISTDPLLASAVYGNVHIQPTSPCVNAGWNGATGISSTDMDGEPRIAGGTVDIGADEAGVTVWPSGPCVIVRVSPSGNDANDGSSWTLAKKTVQAGIDTASMLGGDVWVKAGVYNERVVLAPYAYIFGGFAGVENSRSERNWATNKTILDGGANGSVVTIAIGWQVNTIDGFTIRNGNTSYGGGIYCAFSSPTIMNNTITGNSASNAGGGIYSTYASPTITNNTITGNNAPYGGGIYCGNSSLTITNNMITGNSASGGSYNYGGGIYCDTSSLTITNNVITGNSASGGSHPSGGGIMCSNSSPSITNNTIVGNNATYGGGINCGYGYSTASSFAISNNIVAFNSSGIYSNGGILPALRNNCVYGNSGYGYSGLTAGVGDISDDPWFVGEATGDYHILLTSPCVDAGWNLAPGLPLTDMDGVSRICGGTVDIGAYEPGIGATPKPDVTPAAGAYRFPITVSASIPTTGAIIRYTTNGAIPTEQDPVASGPITLTGACTFKARAWKDGLLASPVGTRVYTFLPTATPTISVAGGTQYYPFTVTITCSTGGSVIHYTTNGLEPTESDPIVAGPVLVDKPMTLKAAAWATGYGPSLVATVKYLLPEITIASLKKKANAQSVTTDRSAVTCVIDSSQFYIESDDRSSGIRVSKALHGMTAGMRAKITGTLSVVSGEKIISATSVVQNGSWTIAPLVVRNRDLGGADWLYNSSTNAGQCGMKEYRMVRSGDTWVPTLMDAAGLNTIGLFITTTGRVTHVGSSFFYIDDGSNLRDGFNYNSGYCGVMVGGAVPVQAGVDPVGMYVKVTGASSCFKTGVNAFRTVRAIEVVVLQSNQ